jgi:hypothetical protein
LVGGLKRHHGSAVIPARPVLTGLDLTTPERACLRITNQCAARNRHPRGTFHFAFLSLEVEIKTIDETLPACPGPMMQRPEIGDVAYPLLKKREPESTVQVNNVADDPPEPPLLDACAAALNENHQHDHKQNTGDNPNNGGVVHFDFPFLSTRWFQLPRASPDNENRRRRSGSALIPQRMLSWC